MTDTDCSANLQADELPSEFWAALAIIGVMALAFSKSLVSWFECLERRHNRGQLLVAYRRRREWKKSDIAHLKSLGVNESAKKRMGRLTGRGRPVVRPYEALDTVILGKLNKIALLISPEGSPEERRRAFKNWPLWRHHIEAYYRGELALARQQGLKNPSFVAEERIGLALGMSVATVHSICGEIRRLRKADAESANLLPLTLADHERWMVSGNYDV